MFTTEVTKIGDADVVLHDLDATHKICQALLKTPHYAKIGPEGIFAIVQKAKVLGVHPLEALNGGLWCLQGKVEMSAQLMNQLIRQAGHSITKDPSSDDSICILHGKRADNGDTWTESFSIQDAKRAGIYSEKSAWGKYPRAMLFARALSMLARQLFPDVIKNCYVEGEIRDAIPLDAQVRQDLPKEPEPVARILEEEAIELLGILNECSPDYQDKVKKFIKRSNLNTIFDLPKETYEKLKIAALENKEKYEQELKDALDAQLPQEEAV